MLATGAGTDACGRQLPATAVRGAAGGRVRCAGPPATQEPMIRADLLAAVHDALVAVGVDPPAAIGMERPARREHGDWSTNAALVSAKAAGRIPRQLGQQLADQLTSAGVAHVERLEVAGPGFVNFHLAPTWLHDVLEEVVAAGEAGYARTDAGADRPVNVEFVSSNPTGPLHAGGGRWAAYGDSLCRLLERCGHPTHREFYVNDRGVQTVLFGRSLEARKRGGEPPEDGYLGDYVTEWAAEMPDDVDPVEWGRDRALRDVRHTLAAMHVAYDTWASEKALVESGAVEATLAELRAAGHVYEHEGATWLRTTTFGDDKDRVLVRSDGEPTYFLPDIAYHRDKFTRGDLLIDVLGADHHGYVSRMQAALQALGHPPEDYEVIIGQNVTLLRGGQEVKLSKRAGTMVEVRELVDDVGPDVARFAYLLQSIDTTQTIDIDVLRAQANENPVFYVQYAHARIHSVGKEAATRGIERRPLDAVDLSGLVHDRELELLRVLSTLPEVVPLAAAERAPHKVANWARELAAAFHGFYHDCPILRSDVDDQLQQARLWLVESTRVGLAIGLDLLGVSAPEQL
jgi:arginyl-tRNA synthetase